MASAESDERIEHIEDKADICDEILALYRSMPDKTVSYTLKVLEIFIIAPKGRSISNFGGLRWFLVRTRLYTGLALCITSESIFLYRASPVYSQMRYNWHRASIYSNSFNRWRHIIVN